MGHKIEKGIHVVILCIIFLLIGIFSLQTTKCETIFKSNDKGNYECNPHEQDEFTITPLLEYDAGDWDRVDFGMTDYFNLLWREKGESNWNKIKLDCYEFVIEYTDPMGEDSTSYVYRTCQGLDEQEYVWYPNNSVFGIYNVIALQRYVNIDAGTLVELSVEECEDDEEAELICVRSNDIVEICWPIVNEVINE